MHNKINQLIQFEDTFNERWQWFLSQVHEIRKIETDSEHKDKNNLRIACYVYPRSYIIEINNDTCLRLSYPIKSQIVNINGIRQINRNYHLIKK